MAAGIEITYTLGGRGVASLETLDRSKTTATAQRNALHDLVVIQDSKLNQTLFTGTILDIGDEAMGEPNIGVKQPIKAADFTRACDARIIPFNGTITGLTVRAIITAHIGPLLTPFGITLDASMAAGPVIPSITFDNIRVSTALSRLCTMAANYTWRITPLRVLECFEVGSKIATFALTSTNGKIRGGVKWEKTATQRVNRIYGTYGAHRVAEVTQVFPAAAPGNTAWTLDEKASDITLNGYIDVDTIHTPIGIYGVDTTMVWTWEAAFNRIRRNPGAIGGEIVSVTYNAQYPGRVTVADATAALEPWEDVQHLEDVYHKNEAISIFTGMIARHTATPRTAEITTRAGVALPGDVISLTIPERTIATGYWLVTGARFRTEVDRNFTFTYTLVEGLTATDSWVDRFKHITTAASISSTLGSAASVALSSTGEATETLNSHIDGSASAATVETTTGYIGASSQAYGPGVRYGRIGEGYAWSVLAHMASPSTPNLRWVPMVDASAYRFAMQLRRSSAGVYHLLPSEVGATHLGDWSNVTGLASTERQFDSLYATKVYAATLLEADGAEVNTGVSSPAQLTGNVHNYVPTEVNIARTVRLISSMAVTITGIAAQASGTILRLLNVNPAGSAFGITLAHADTVNSTAANSFICPSHVNFVIPQGGGVEIWYDGTSSLWRVVKA